MTLSTRTISANSIADLKTAFDAEMATVLDERILSVAIAGGDLTRTNGVEFILTLTTDDGQAPIGSPYVLQVAQGTLPSDVEDQINTFMAANTDYFFGGMLPVYATEARLLERYFGVQIYNTDSLDGETNWGVSVPVEGFVGKVTSIDDTDSPYDASPGETVFVDTTNNPVTVNMPPAAELIGREITVLRTSGGANAGTVSPDGAETINGLGFWTLGSQYSKAAVISDGTNLFLKDN
jgi:hypothetical protein